MRVYYYPIFAVLLVIIINYINNVKAFKMLHISHKQIIHITLFCYITAENPYFEPPLYTNFLAYVFALTSYFWIFLMCLSVLAGAWKSFPARIAGCEND